MGVVRLELTPAIPTLARRDVSAAKTDERIANKIHTVNGLLICRMVIIPTISACFMFWPVFFLYEKNSQQNAFPPRFAAFLIGSSCRSYQKKMDKGRVNEFFLCQDDPKDLPCDMCSGMGCHGILNAVSVVQVSKDQSAKAIQKKASRQNHRRYFPEHLHGGRQMTFMRFRSSSEQSRLPPSESPLGIRMPRVSLSPAIDLIPNSLQITGRCSIRDNAKRPEDHSITWLSLLARIPAVFILIGVTELVSERIPKAGLYHAVYPTAERIRQQRKQTKVNPTVCMPYDSWYIFHDRLGLLTG